MGIKMKAVEVKNRDFLFCLRKSEHQKSFFDEIMHFGVHDLVKFRFIRAYPCKQNKAFSR